MDTDGNTIRKDFSFGEPDAFSAPAPPSPMVAGHTLERGGLSVQVTTYSKPDAVRDADVNRSGEDGMFRTDEQGNALRLLLLGGSPETFLRSPFVATRSLSPEGTVLTLKKKYRLVCMANR